MVSMTGVGLGSFARESRAFGDQQIKRKLANLQEQQIQQQNQVRVRENINQLVAAASGLAERAAESGRDVSAQIAPLRQRVAATAQLANMNPEQFLATFDAATTGFPTRAEKGTAAGIEEAAKQNVETANLASSLEFVLGLPDEQKDMMLQKMGFVSGAPPEILRLLAEREDLLKSGRGLQDPDVVAIQSRIQRLTQATQPGLSIRFGPDGRVESITEGGAAPGSAPGAATGRPMEGLATVIPGTKQFDVDQRLALVQRNKERIGELIARTKTDPEDFGVFASVRNLQQNVTSVAADVAAMLSSKFGEDTTGPEILDSFADAIGVETLFDPNISSIETVERSLAADLVKLRVARGGDDVRAVAKLFNQALQDVRLKGFVETAASVQSRLKTILEEFEKEEAAIRTGLGGPANAPPDMTLEDADAEIERLQKLIREKGGE